MSIRNRVLDVLTTANEPLRLGDLRGELSDVPMRELAVVVNEMVDEGSIIKEGMMAMSRYRIPLKVANP